MEEENEELDLNDTSLDNFDDFLGEDGQTPISKHSDLLKDLTNFDPAIQERIKNWLGLEWNDKLKDYEQTQTAIINEKGARWAIGVLKTYMTKTNIITNISQPEFKNLQKDIIKICWLVFPTRDDFGVKNNADWYRLCTELDNSAFLVLAGAGDGKYTKFLGESVTRHENISLTPERQAAPRKNMGPIEMIKGALLGRK